MTTCAPPMALSGPEPRVACRMIVVAGPPCAGKSTLAGTLAEAAGAPHLEMDQFRLRALPASDMRTEHRDIAYRSMHLAAELMAPHCGAVVLDATYTARECRLDLAAALGRAGALLVVVECHVPAYAAVDRFLRRRGHAAADLTPQRVASLAARYPYCDAARAVWYGRSCDRDQLIRQATDGAMTEAQIRRWCECGRPRSEDAAPVVPTLHDRSAAAGSIA